MTDPQSAANGASQPLAPSSTHSVPFPSLPVPSEASSSNNLGQYQPLPEGRWIIPIHGNCPGCHHHHSATQVKIEVTKDDSQVSWVDCERCKEKWAAFGGRNATMISLLSDTTTDADSIEREVRLCLIDIVKLATNAASLGTLTEQSSNISSHKQPVEVPSHGIPSAALPSSQSSTPAMTMTADQPAKHDQAQRPPEIAPRSVTPCDDPKNSSGLRRYLSTLKRRIATRLPILHRAKFKQIVRLSGQPTMSLGHTESSPLCTQTVHDHQEIHETQSPLVNAPEGIESLHLAHEPPPTPHVPELATRFKDVATFIGSLDQSELKSMDEKQRAAWMRKHYTDFKARNKMHRASLSISEVFQTSIQNEPPRMRLNSRNRFSADVCAIGTNFDVLEQMESNSAARRWGSLSISDRLSEAGTSHDDITVASFPQYSPREHLQRVRGRRTQRPLSLQHNTTRSSPHLRHLIRQSLPVFLYNGARGTSTTRGQASVRWSQGSTPSRSPLSFHVFTTQESLNHPVD